MYSFVHSQSIDKNAATAGNYFSNSSFNISYSFGETFSGTIYNVNNKLSQGIQQPLAIDSGVMVNLTAFLQGFYIDSNKMTSCFSDPTIQQSLIVSDIVTVQLRNASSPHSIIYTKNNVIHTNGNINFLVPLSAIGNSYYIVIKHRNSIETWSATPLVIGSSGTTYNFSNAVNKAFGDNLSDMGNGVFAIFSGDINQDGSVDFNDYPTLDIASNDGILGYDVNDLNGDASVDFNDYPLIDINSNNGVLAIRP
jgi:hypothetical protein